MTKWSVVINPAARKDLDRLSRANCARILRFLNDRVSRLDNPRQVGGPLKGTPSTFWRYGVGDVRILCRVAVGNRRKIHR